MILYHGTTETVARKALIEGLKPRNKTGHEGNWEHTVSSNSDIVYLTRCYAPYFAYTASNNGEKWGILSIETDLLDEELMRPDEDWLEQATRRNKQVSALFNIEGMDMNERTRWFRANLWMFADLWKKSIKGLGSCAYAESIPSDAIRHAVVYDPKSNVGITLKASDPTITLINYLILGNQYAILSRWFIHDDVTPQEISGDFWKLYNKQQREITTQMINDRSGLKIIK